ncbi:MAG: Hpt domain-containing protein [Candidatus Levybacteria bacterium]|nr:Hpt domain-containing protein [Candidatus Levybacteria bacterium]
MDNSDLSAFKALFVETARKQIAEMQTFLRELSANTNDRNAVNHMYIAAHSLRGESLAMGYFTNGSLAHLLEKIFQGAKDKSFTLTPAILTEVSTAVQKLSESIDSIEREDKECALNDERMALEKLTGIMLEQSL